jgi:hypothetical protein
MAHSRRTWRKALCEEPGGRRGVRGESHFGITARAAYHTSRPSHTMSIRQRTADLATSNTSPAGLQHRRTRAAVLASRLYMPPA